MPAECSSDSIDAVSSTAARPAMASGRYARFERLVSVHIPALTRVARRICPNRETAEDVVQETLLRAWRHLDRLREPKAVKGWLFVILRNERARTFGKAPPHGADLDIDTLPASCTIPNMDALNIRRQVNAMPEKFRAPLALFAFEGYDISEISTTLGIKSATVKTRLFRARKKLREEIEARQSYA